MKALKTIAIIDLIVIVLSACAADSASILPLVVCCISTFLMIPIAMFLKEGEDDDFIQ